MFPIEDVKIVETEQMSTECLAKYICQVFLSQIEKEMIKETQITKVEIKVYDDLGECGIYCLKYD